MDAELEYKIAEGGIWEFQSFNILKNYIVRRASCHCICRHAIPQENGRHIIPYVFEALNEGGYCSTGICAQCALEAFEQIKRGSLEP